MKFALTFFAIVTSMAGHLAVSANHNEPRRLRTSRKEVDQRIPFKVVVMGDSYTSGIGARDANGKVNFEGPADCYRSPTNWGGTYASALNATGKYAVTYLNRACGGGKIPDILNPQPKGTFPGRCPKPNYPDELYVQETAVTCKYYMKPQIEGVDNTTDLVMMTMGANDWGVVPVMLACLVARKPELCQATVQRGNQLLPRVPLGLYDVTKALYQRMKPGARVVFLSTPLMVLERVSYVLDNLVASEISVTDSLRGLLLQEFAEIKSMTESVNAELGVPFAMLYNETPAYFSGHEMDPRPYFRNPFGWIKEAEGLYTLEWFHPFPEAWMNWGYFLAANGTTFGAGKAASQSDRSLKTTDATPYAWMGEAYSGKVGEPIQLEASGSYDPLGYVLAKYEWDFNDDGVYDATTSQPYIEHVYEEAYQGRASLQVTSQSGRTAKCTAFVHIRAGHEVFPHDQHPPCQVDSHGDPILWVDGQGWQPCALVGN